MGSAALETRPAAVRGRLRLERLERPVRRARIALTLVFLVLGALSGSWAARIPAVKADLHLSAGALGFALLGPAVGLVASTFPTGAALVRLTPRPLIGAGVVLYAASMPLAARAGGTGSLFVVLLVWGFGAGMIDVAMNTEAAGLQSLAGRPIMSGLHAAYSVGALVGAAAGALAASEGVSVGWHLLLASVLTGAVGLGAVVALPGGTVRGRAGETETSETEVGETDAGEPGGPRRHRTGRPRSLPHLTWGLVALAVVAFGCFLAEGATVDWSAVYLHGSLGASVGFAAVGYTVFAVAMTLGRLAGDRVGHAVGPVRMVRVSTAVAAIGFAATLVAGNRTVALVGFAVLGLGLSVVVPQVFSAAAHLGGASSGPSLALVTACGYVGLMAGPPLIGGLADQIGLPAALATIVLVAAVSCLLAGGLRRAQPG